MSTETTPFSFKNPYPAQLKSSARLTGPASEKDTRHLEILLGDSGIRYLAGDALGVMPANCPELVDELLEALRASGDEPVPGRDGQPKSLREALTFDYAITFSDRKFIEAVAARGVSSLQELLVPERIEDLRRFLQGRDEVHDYVDILIHHPEVSFAPEEFVKLLGKLKPRLYSIASSLHAHPGEVHLTVAAVTYTIRGRLRKGVCSTFVSDRWGKSVFAGVWVQNQQKHFGLPASGDKPIIMVGPGTGVAPFRAYLEERQALGAKGRNWLFFGEQRRASDFLYESQFTEWEKQGFLRLDTAFSRDQAEKIYVQHRLAEHGADVWRWLEDGADFFVCGDKDRMAGDVHAELLRIVEKHGGKTPEQAAEYLEEMKKAKRYKRDVY